MPLPKKADFGNVQDLVDVKDIRESTVVMKNGSFRQIVMVGGVNFSLKSEEEQNIITQGYQNFLNGINFPIQIIIHSRKINIEHYVARLDEYREHETTGLLQDQIGEYQEFVRGFIKDNPIMVKTFFVVVPYAPIALPTSGSSFLKSLPFFGTKNQPAEQQAKNAEEEEQAREVAFQEGLSQLKQRVAQVVQGFSAIGLECVALDDEQLVELFYNFYNPETVEKQGVVTPKS